MSDHAPSITPDSILKEGWLFKQSKFIKEWRRRWFVLTATHLYSFKSQGVYKNPTEVIDLRNCSTVKSAEEELNTEFAFRVDTPDRTFFLQASELSDKESWIGSIGRAMVRPSVMRSYSEEQEYDN
eukprot:GILK01001187.1.p1 GENE.GILK01001187.1~~GILK01001187.1.p1  ORF type:complete len:126 (-),score=15.73 GILK01001187.1:153-530(-)